MLQFCLVNKTPEWGRVNAGRCRAGAAFAKATSCFSKGTLEAQKKGTRAWQGSLPSTAPRILPRDLGRGPQYSRRTEGPLPCCGIFFLSICKGVGHSSPSSGDSYGQCSKTIPTGAGRSPTWELPALKPAWRNKAPSPPGFKSQPGIRLAFWLWAKYFSLPPCSQVQNDGRERAAQMDLS